MLCHGSNDSTGKDDLPLLRPEHVLIGFLRPLGSIETIREVAARGVTSFAVELMPRTTRAQSMDALTSMATIAGYKAVVIGADRLPRIFPDADHRGGHDHAGARARDRGRRGRACRRSRRHAGWAPSPRRTTCARPRRNRSRAWAGASSSLPSRPRTPRTPAVTPAHRTTRSTSGSGSCSGRSSRKATSSSRPRSFPARNRPCW